MANLHAIHQLLKTHQGCGRTAAALDLVQWESDTLGKGPVCTMPQRANWRSFVLRPPLLFHAAPGWLSSSLSHRGSGLGSPLAAFSGDPDTPASFDEGGAHPRVPFVAHGGHAEAPKALLDYPYLSCSVMEVSAETSLSLIWKGGTFLACLKPQPLSQYRGSSTLKHMT